MTDTKFTIGQNVRFLPPTFLRNRHQDGYTVTRVLPSEGGERQYRIRNAAEAHERVAQESHLAPSSTILT